MSLAALDRLIASPFQRLAALLDGIAPGMAQIDLSLGEPRHAVPDFVAPILAEHTHAFGKYPPIRGTADLRAAIGGWIGRRYPSLAGAVDPEAHILPLNGSREGLFSAIFPALARKEAARPAVLIPNPFYQAYLAAAVAAGAEPVFLPARKETGFLPDLDALDAETLGRAAAIYLCSPSNPEGAVASEAYWARLISLARAHDFVVFADECYSEIYAAAPPPGALAAAAALGEGLRNVISFNSLSKRSNLPGLRSGFAAGDADFIAAFQKFRSVACPQTPLPVQAVAAHAWREETHVAANRALYAAKFAIADEALGGMFGYARPEGGFFLWLDLSALGGGEAAAQTLWQSCGVKILPGAYLAQDEAGGLNPGTDFARLALVADEAATREALMRLAGLAPK
jgi:N-succinyldiaminopimelate aminotransferase